MVEDGGGKGEEERGRRRGEVSGEGGREPCVMEKPRAVLPKLSNSFTSTPF